MTQDALDLDAIEADPLREAYELAGYARRGITFAQATSNDKKFRHLAIALRLRAESLLKERQCQQR